MSMQRYPAVEDLARRARRRIPRFAFDYVDGGIGPETGVRRNRERLDAVTLVPRYLVDVARIDLTTELFGMRHAAPFGIAPMGLSSLMWPGTERILAGTAARAGIPYGLSTVCTVDMEEIPPIAGDKAWFQLYAPGDEALALDIVGRAREAGFSALAITVDVPVAGRRERDIKNGLSVPPRITADTIYRAAIRPAWSLATLAAGRPRFRTLERYVPPGMDIATFINRRFATSLTWDLVKRIRDAWPRPLMLKGILRPAEADTALAIGVDGIWVSNHGGRQLDAAPAAIDVLPAIVAAVAGRAPVLVDSGVSSGLDVARCLARGADFVLAGRAFMWGVCALGAEGGDHAVAILRDGLATTLAQLGCPAARDLDGSWLAET